MKKKFKDKVQRRYHKALLKVGAASGVIALMLSIFIEAIIGIITGGAVFIITGNIMIYLLQKKYKSKNKKVPNWLKKIIKDNAMAREIDNQQESSSRSFGTDPRYSSSPCNAFYRY